MPLTLKQAREKQESAKSIADLTQDKEERRRCINDMLWLSGYMAAMIDWEVNNYVTISAKSPVTDLSGQFE